MNNKPRLFYTVPYINRGLCLNLSDHSVVKCKVKQILNWLHTSFKSCYPVGEYSAECETGAIHHTNKLNYLSHSAITLHEGVCKVCVL